MIAPMLVGVVVIVVAMIAVAWLMVRSRGGAETRREEPGGGEAATADESRIRTGQGWGPHPRPRELDRESRRELRLLDERLHRAFFEQSELRPAAWAQIADDLLIVHDGMPVGIAVERFEEATGSSVSAPAESDRSPREIVAMLNEQLSPERRMELIATIEEPLAADVYAPGECGSPDT